MSTKPNKEVKTSMTGYWTKIIGLIVLLSTSHFCWGFAIPQPEEEITATKMAFIQLNAAQGDVEAEYLLGLMYISGRYLEQNYQEGFKWLEHAARLGHEKAQRALADLYFDGKILPRNLKKAVSWYKIMAKRGDNWAHFRLGLIYAAGGNGIKRNCGTAVQQFSIAGDNASMGNVAWILATCPESKYRDGARAVQLSLKLLKTDEQDPSLLDNLAAAYAEVGDFSAAVSTQQRAIHALMKRPEVAGVDEFKQRLKYYLQKRAYRETIPLL